jgi:preprotein translocase subunit SecE
MQTRLVAEGYARRHPFRAQMRRVVAIVLSFVAFFVCFSTFIA